MIKLDKPIADYTIRVAALVVPQFISGFAVMSYHPSSHSSKTLPPAKKAAIDYGGNVLKGYKALDPLTLKPFPPLPPIPHANMTLIFDMFRVNALTWAMNKDPFKRELGQTLKPMERENWKTDALDSVLGIRDSSPLQSARESRPKRCCGKSFAAKLIP